MGAGVHGTAVRQFRKLVRIVAGRGGEQTVVGRPVPGNHNDCTAYRDSGAERACRGAHVMADGGCQGNPQVIMPYRRPRDGGELPAWQEDLNATHRSVRVRARTPSLT